MLRVWRSIEEYCCTVADDYGDSIPLLSETLGRNGRNSQEEMNENTKMPEHESQADRFTRSDLSEVRGRGQFIGPQEDVQ